MTDWKAFTEAIPWFVSPKQSVTTDDLRCPLTLSTPFQERFPVLTNLLNRAQVTGVTIDSTEYDLLGWDSDEGFRIGWLCHAAVDSPPDDLLDDHRLLLSGFGGVLERFNEPEDTWLLNHNGAMTLGEAAHDASFISNYRWAFDDAGIAIPIGLSEFYTVAREANGNATLCHRETGEVILFAPDHAYDHIACLKGCPEYTLYTIDGVLTFVDWVEAIAGQWLVHATEIAQKENPAH